MIPKISRGSNPAGLVRYLFGKGRHNEHTNQHLVCASGDLLASFDMDGQPTESFKRIGERFDQRYRMLEDEGDPYPPDQRGKRNPDHEHGRERVWHCSLSIRADQGVLTDQQWEDIVRDYLKRMRMDQGGTDSVSWLVVRHGLSRNGNDHVHLVVQLATADGWINPWHDRVNAQKTCRSMERERPELVELSATTHMTRTRWTYRQWRQWAEWKAEHDWRDDHAERPWNTLSRDEQARLIAHVAQKTMPRHTVGRLVEACAQASRSEDEFIRRVRREGLNIDPRLRKGVTKGSFDDPDQVVGYRITWRSADGWTERFTAFDLADDLRLKPLRVRWRHDSRSDALAVQEWRAAMENRPPFLDDGNERRAENLTTHDMERLIDQAFAVATSLENTDGDDYAKAMREGLRTFDRLREQYGIDHAATPGATPASGRSA